jgi:hypothetical protein
MTINEFMIIEGVLSFIVFGVLSFAVFFFIFLIKNERKRDEYEKLQLERENTILDRTDIILQKLVLIELQQTKIQKEILRLDVRMEQNEKDIKELFRSSRN